MTTEATPVEIEVTLRHVEPEVAVKDYVGKRLSGVIHSLPGLRTAFVEITFEHARPAAQRYIGQVTLAATGRCCASRTGGQTPSLP